MEILRLLDGANLHTKINRQTPVEIWLQLCPVQDMLNNARMGAERKIPHRIAVFPINFASPNQLSTIQTEQAG